MIDFKEVIAKSVGKVIEIDIEKIKTNIEVPKDLSMGDLAFPCFILAKELNKNPMEIAKEIKEKLEENKEIKDYIEKIEAVGGFLNFTLNKKLFIAELLNEFENEKEDFGKTNIGQGKTVLVEYSSPNIAKEFHIGHLKNTIIGHALYNVYKYLGYNTIGLNHLGDYGTQFAKLIEGYKRWKNEYDFSEEPIAKMADMYVRINRLCSEDESVLEECRETFKKLEEGDEFCIKLWQEFKDLSLVEFNKIYELLGVKFDSMNGEAFYSDKMQEVIDILNKNGKITESQGAKVVDLADAGIDTPCIIQKANGSSIYATRDLAAILYRARTYNFDKCLYVVGIEQSLHFKQIFEVAKYLDLDIKYINGLEHISYGMIRLPEGKMSSRKGNFVTARDLLSETIDQVKEIMQDREIENKDKIAEQIGIGAIVFNNLSENRVKDSVFVLDQALNFNGETGPYLQYICVRAKSVLEKAGYIPNLADVNVEILQDKESMQVINMISNFKAIIKSVAQRNEPSILARYLINLAQSFSVFYNNNRILEEEKEIQDSRLYLTYMVKTVLEKGLELLGIEVPEKM